MLYQYLNSSFKPILLCRADKSQIILCPHLIIGWHSFFLEKLGQLDGRTTDWLNVISGAKRNYSNN